MWVSKEHVAIHTNSIAGKTGSFATPDEIASYCLAIAALFFQNSCDMVLVFFFDTERGVEANVLGDVRRSSPGTCLFDALREARSIEWSKHVQHVVA